MKLDISNFQALAANLTAEGAVCDVAGAKLSTETETDTEIAPLIEKVGAPSIAEFDRVMAKLQEQKILLQSEAERIQGEAARYVNLTQMVSASVKIILDTVSGWREAGHPMPEFEIIRSPAKDSTDRMEGPID
jgi:prophage DNA circulation protein